MSGMSAVIPAPRFEPHSRLAGRFRIRKRLAMGGMGEVWVARNEATGADVALKVLRRGDADRERELQMDERFRREARLSATLSHRNIVKVFDLIEETDGTLVLVMELLRGETLQDYVEREGHRPAREAVAIVAPILGALGHAHDCGVVHRDVTPSNIFLAIDPDGRVTPKLVDFGLAKPAAAPSEALSASHVRPVETVEGRVLGTPRYMAPERIRGSGEIDGRADVFAAAVVLYETMTGVSPFAASTASASLAAVLERHVDPDRRIEPRLWVEIQRALSKRPYERHATAYELAAALRAAIGEAEGTLEASLRRAPVPVDWLDDAGSASRSMEHETFEGQSVAAPRPRRRLSPGWLIAAALVGLSLGLLALWLRTPPARSAVAEAPASRSTATSLPVATPAPTLSEIPTVATTPPQPSSLPMQRAPHSSAKPKAIATTPGF
jgi:serine/threonine-protein kinase